MVEVENLTVDDERLRRLVGFELLKRVEFPGLPARVDYELTATGRKLVKIIDQLKSLNEAHGER